MGQGLGRFVAAMHAVMDQVVQRQVAADEAGIAYDHAAAEAMVVVTGALDDVAEGGNPDASALILEVAAGLLRATPQTAPFATFQDLLRVRMAEVVPGVGSPPEGPQRRPRRRIVG